MSLSLNKDVKRDLYLNIAIGIDCIGHNNVILEFNLPSTVRVLSPELSRGGTLPTGSVNWVKIILHVDKTEIQ